MSPIRHVDHVQLPIPVGGSPKARQFYEGVLGLRELRDPGLDRPGTLRFALVGQRLDLTEGSYTGVAPQAHVAFAVADVERVGAHLRQAGVLFQHAPLPDRDRLYVEDPFGNRLELIGPIPETPTHVTQVLIAV